MAEYRYLVTEALTGNTLGELPLGSVKFSEKLNEAGELTATLDLAARTRGGLSLADMLLTQSTPRRTRLWVDRDGQLVWSGLIWRRTRPKGSTGIIDISAVSTLGYFSHRRLTTDMAAVATDQLDIARGLISWALAQPGGDIGVQVGAETSGVLLTRAPLAWGYELRTITEIISELVLADGGFDISIDPTYVADVPTDVLHLHYPRRGRSLASSNLVFFTASTRGGNLLDWEVDEDATDSATQVWGIGAGEGDGMLLAVATRTDLIDAGYPLTDSTISYKSITDGDALANLALAEVNKLAATPLAWSIEVDPDDVSTPFGTWIVGDDALLRIDDDPRFPAGLDGSPGTEVLQRIFGHEVSVGDDGGADVVTLTLGAPRG